MRKSSMDTFAESKGRSFSENPEKRSKNDGSETKSYFKEKPSVVMEFCKEELKQNLELREQNSRENRGT